MIRTVIEEAKTGNILATYNIPLRLDKGDIIKDEKYEYTVMKRIFSIPEDLLKIIV